MQYRPARLAALLFSLFIVAPALPARAQAPAPKPASPSTIEAQSIEGVSELEVTARGKVEFKREDLTIYSEFLRYNQEFGRIEANDGVRLQRGLDRFSGPRLRYNTREDTGVFEDSTYVLQGETSTMRGKSERMEFLGRDKLRLVNATFSTCEPGKEDWRFEAGEFELDNERQRGTVRDARLKFFDTTILPLPYGTFSLDNQRKSGFLAPFYSHNSRRGVELAAPYYWNIAPERDLTITPAYMTKRGEQLKGEFRYISPNYFGNLNAEYMPRDQELDRSRGAISLQHQQYFTPKLWGNLDINRVTDSRYFVDLASQVRQVSAGNLQQMGQLSYNSASTAVPGLSGYYLSGMVQHWQTLQDPLAPIVPPYAREPQFNFGVIRNDIGGRFDVGVPGEYVRFAHPTLVEGSRLQFNPTVAAPFLAPGYFITPKLGLHYADYSLSRQAAGIPERQGVSVPWMSLDSGVIFDRPVSWFGEQRTQTLEPRLYYLYAPFRDQDKIPVFDTGLADFNYAQLFTENRFAGGDRFGDANQLTLAMTSRMLTSEGTELLRGTIGQRYYFENERVGLTPTSTLRTRNQSDFIAALGGRVTRALSFDSAVQYNAHDSRAERFSVAARYAPEIAKVVSASYRYNRDQQLRQIDLTGQWPVSAGWYAIGRLNYSLYDSRILEAIAGIEYNAGCWVFRAAAQRLQAAVDTTSTGIFFQLEFNGFGSLGSDEIVGLLKRSVPGYAVTNPNQPGMVPPSMQQRLPFQQAF